MISRNRGLLLKSPSSRSDFVTGRRAATGLPREVTKTGPFLAFLAYSAREPEALVISIVFTVSTPHPRPTPGCPPSRPRRRQPRLAQDQPPHDSIHADSQFGVPMLRSDWVSSASDCASHALARRPIAVPYHRQPSLSSARSGAAGELPQQRSVRCDASYLRHPVAPTSATVSRLHRDGELPVPVHARPADAEAAHDRFGIRG